MEIMVILQILHMGKCNNCVYVFNWNETGCQACIDDLKHINEKEKGFMKKIKIKKGLSSIEFTDFYNKHCSIQESSLSTQRAIWFGVDNARMHLTIDRVKEILPILNLFVETGEII